MTRQGDTWCVRVTDGALAKGDAYQVGERLGQLSWDRPATEFRLPNSHHHNGRDCVRHASSLSGRKAFLFIYGNSNQ